MLINARFITRKITGVDRFAGQILQAAARSNLLKNATLIAPPVADLPQKAYGLPVRSFGCCRGHIWEQMSLPFAARDDFLVNLCNAAPLFTENQFVMLHDALFAARPQSFTVPFRAWYHVMTRSYGKMARVIGTPSRFAADEIMNRLGISASKIEIIPESGEHILDEPADTSLHQKHNLEKGSYILAVGSLAPHKNFEGLLEALPFMEGLPYRLLIAGGGNAIFGKTLATGNSSLTTLGYVTTPQLRALYENAACFVFPSFYEGFGLPPLEAQACGCPVITSNAASLPEVCGNSALYCDPSDPQNIARTIRRLLESKDLQDTLREEGYANAQKWTWHAAALKLSQVLEKAASRS